MELRSLRKRPSSGFLEETEPTKKRKNMDGIPSDGIDFEGIVAGESTSQLESLPLEILNLIFSYLSFFDKMNMRLVCKRLCLVSNDPGHWRCVVIPPNINSKNPNYVKSILKHTKSHVRLLSLVGYSSTTSSYLTSCTSVTALDLYGSRITNQAMKQLLLKLPNLSRLSVSDGIAQALLPMLSSLQQLVVQMRPLGYSHNLQKRSFELLFAQLLKKAPLPSNIAIKYVDSNGLYYPSPSEHFFCSVESGPRFSPVHDFNLSEYTLSSTNTLQAVSTPSYIYNSTVHMGFQISVPDAAAQHSTFTASTAVSSSVLSANITYTHVLLKARSFARLSAPSLVKICPLNDMITMNITSLDFKGTALQSFDDVKNIVRCTPNLLVISINDIWFANPDPLDGFFKALAMFCPKVRSIFAIPIEKLSIQCYVQDLSEVWNDILSLKYLEHLSVCSCLFQVSPPNDNSYRPNLKLLPTSFESLVLRIHQTESVQVINLDFIISIIRDIRRLRMLHLYIDAIRQLQDNTGPLDLRLLDSCAELEELIIKLCNQSSVEICSTPVVGRLKCLKLIDVNVISNSFLTDLVPIGQQNVNLEVLHLDVQRLCEADNIIRILEHCPSLVSITYVPVSIPGFETAKEVGKRLNLLNFGISKLFMFGWPFRHRLSILRLTNNIYFSLLNIM